MKKLIIGSLAAFLAYASLGQSIPLTWDASPTTNVTYRLYGHTNSLFTLPNLTNSIVKVNVGTNRFVTISNMLETVWYFGVTAVNTNGIESDMSNMLIVDVPKAPANLRPVIIQWAGTIATTNWIDAIFLKLKIGQ